MTLLELPASYTLRAHVAPISKSLQVSLFFFHNTSFHILEFLYRKPSYRLRFWCLTISIYCRNRYVCSYGVQHQQLAEHFQVVTSRRHFCSSFCPRYPLHLMNLQSLTRHHWNLTREGSNRTSTFLLLLQLRAKWCHLYSI